MVGTEPEGRHVVEPRRAQCRHAHIAVAIATRGRAIGLTVGIQACKQTDICAQDELIELLLVAKDTPERETIEADRMDLSITEWIAEELSVG